MKRTTIKTPLIASLLSLVVTCGLPLNSVHAADMSHDPVMVGGQAMMPSKDIIDNAVNSADHTTLVAAVKAAGLVDTLKGKGPFTVFAPVNAAFAALPAGTVDTLLKPANKATLSHILTYHVVAGKLDMAALAQQIKAGGGKAELTTVSGGKLWVTMNGPHNITLKDEKGATADITTYDVYQSNGVIQVIDKVLMPKS
ncbi:fasciclin domain-containing protein [Pseudomonas fluorescens]|uniref:fasciclin domain-containing protein n=1 Tax=Pseudomonas TaxID=286 RepID=UPI003D01622F